MSLYPKIILYICTKQINFLRISSEAHFSTPSLSWYFFSDPQMTDRDVPCTNNHNWMNGREMLDKRHWNDKQTSQHIQARQPNKQMVKSAGRSLLPMFQQAV